ncbi:hypothetical protein SAMN05421882_11381, partial [Nitrosomonas communis]
EQRVRLRSTLAKVRFLNGQLVRAVWCELENDHKPGQWKTAGLLICARPMLGQSGNHHSSSQQRAGSVAITFPIDAR